MRATQRASERARASARAPNLIEGREDVVSELYLGDGRSATSSDTDREASDALLTQGRIEHLNHVQTSQ